MIDECTVLNLDVVPNLDVEIDVDVLSQDASRTDAHILTHLALIPDARAGADFCLFMNLGSGVYSYIRSL